MPKIKARFRKYRGVPFAIEHFTGTQYRCRVCNRVFLKKGEFEKHLQHEAASEIAINPSQECPKVGENTKATVLYIRDFYDEMRQDFLKLPEGEVYDDDP
ncbi:MAG: hypothetical protein ONB44_08520 [candidate division KSB1 bacterium]|nr:hypothetical protein [candidate division KSB1 bacterium]MDZ7302173.1 hypothetical protein [candidate division KSB1 bacterium]MDZ7311282.1 hypothetical protein [candidate division KSB1 bacterium]